MHPRAGHRQRARRPRFGRSVVAVALCFAGLVLAAAFVGITVQGNALAREIAGLHADISAAEADQATLNVRIADQQTQDYVIQKAREYGYIGTNESLYAVQKNEQGSGQSLSSAKAGPSRIERWIAFFFGAR